MAESKDPSPVRARRGGRRARPVINSLTEGPIGPHLVQLTMPMFIGMASMIIASVFDTLFVGRIGTHELAAVSFSFPLVMVMVSLSMGVGIGASSIIARSMGAGNRERVRRLTTHSLLLTALISIVCAALGEIFAPQIFYALGARGQLLALVVQYMHIWFIGLPMFAFPMVATSIMRSVGSAKLPGTIMGMSSVVQVVIAPVLMFGIPGVFGGIGFDGSPWAFVLSRLFTMLLCMQVLTSRLRLITWRGFTWPDVSASWREVMRIGLPASLSNLIGPVSMAIIIGMLTRHGVAVVAALGVASRLESLATMILMSLSGSLSAFIGQNWGAQQDARIRTALNLSHRFSLAWGVFAWLLLVLTGRTLVGLINHDPAVIDATFAYLLLVPLSYGFLGLGMNAGACFMALGKPLPTLVMSISRMLIVYVPLAMLGDHFFGFKGIFGATAFTNVLMGIGAVWWMQRTLRQQIASRAPSAVAAALVPQTAT